jgi:hypothetical protein
MHGPTCIFRANLTPFSPQLLGRRLGWPELQRWAQPLGLHAKAAAPKLARLALALHRDYQHTAEPRADGTNTGANEPAEAGGGDLAEREEEVAEAAGGDPAAREAARRAAMLWELRTFRAAALAVEDGCSEMTGIPVAIHHYMRHHTAAGRLLPPFGSLPVCRRPLWACPRARF